MAAEVRENSEIVGNGKEGQAGDLEEQKHNANQKRQSSRSSAAEYSDDQSSAAKMAAAAQKTSGAAKNFEAPPVSAALELEQHKASWFTNLASGAGSHITKLYEQRAPTALQTAVASGTSAITKRWPFWRGGQSAGVDVEHEGLTENEDKGELQPKPAELKGNGGGEHSRTETAQDVDGVGEPRVQTGAGSAVSAEAQHDQERATLQDAIGGAAAEAGAGGIVGRTQKLKEQATALAESLMKGLYSAPGEAEETSGTTQSDVTGDHVGLVHNGALEEQTEIGRAADVAIADNLKEVAGAQNSVANAAANAAAMTDQKLTKMKQELKRTRHNTPARSTEAFQFAIKPNKQAEYCALPAPECNDGGSAIFPHKSIAESSANVLVADVDVFGVNSQDVKLEDKVQLCRLQCLMNSGCVHWSLTKQQGFSSWSCTLFKHGTGTTLEYSCVQAEQYPNSALSGLPTAFAGCVPSQMKGSWLARDSHFSSSGLLRVGELQTKMNALLDEYVSEGQEVAVQKDKIATAIDEVELPQVKELVEQMNKHITLLANNLDPIARRARAATAAPAQTVA
eukprot:g17508.t1